MPIVLVTKSGYALFEYFSSVPNGEITLVTNNPKLIKLCALYANKITLIEKEITSAPSEILWQLIDSNKEKFFKKREQVAAVYVSKYVKTARANSITIFDRSDFPS